jgi:hypothetical protein
MPSNIVQLPRPAASRPPRDPLGFFVCVGRNDHLELLDLLATGESGIFGIVIDAHNVDRHRDLMIEARRRGLDLILDPKTQQMGLPFGHRESFAALPWGGERHHNVTDFEGRAGRDKAARLVEFAVANEFTQLLGPTHLLSSANDVWLRRDIKMMEWTAEQIDAAGKNLELVYSLAVPMADFRKKDERHALLAAIADAPCAAVWLKVENFGDNATGEKTAAYIEACRDLHGRGVPIIGDHIGGLPGLGALAFGALGGMAHGVTGQQSFFASSWRRAPSSSGGGGTNWRVYLPSLDILMKPAAADALLRSPRIRAKCGCHDTHCCPHGVRDMVERPVRHALYQRAREIESISETAPSLRAARYMDERVRKVSDSVAAIASVPSLDEDTQRSLVKKQGDMSLFRQSMAYLAESSPSESIAISPRRRGATE